MDPFGEVLADAERQLGAAQLQLRQYKAEPAHSTLTELSTTLRDLTGVVKELSDSIRAVQSRPQQFGLDQAEVSRRIEQVGHINNQITDIQEALADARKVQPQLRQRAGSLHSENPFADPVPANNEEVTAEDQQLLYQQAVDEQDQILDSVYDTVQSLRQQANVMSQELEDQAVILDDFELQVDRSGDRLSRARRRVEWVLRNNRDTVTSYCMWLLIIVLIVLLVLAVVT